MKAREPWLAARGHAAGEGLIGLGQPGQHILQHVRVDGGVVGQVGAQVLELRFLLVAARGHAALAVEGDALFQGGVVERATAPQDSSKRTFLVGRGLQLLLIGFARGLHISPALSVRRYTVEWSPGSHGLPWPQKTRASTWRAT